jgi:long-chain fatty acid transport protein
MRVAKLDNRVIMNLKRPITVTWIGIAFLAASTTVFALGFRNPDQDARATAQGEAFVAQADSASAIYYNPAGLTQLEGTHLTSSGYLNFPSYRHSGGTAGGVEMNTEAFIPAFFAATDFGLKDWRFGLGVYVPFGQGVDYGENSPFRYLVTKSTMQVMDLAPTVAYRINDNLSIGAGASLYYGRVQQEQLVSFAAFGAPDGRFRFKGDGVGIGATAGVLWKINEQHAIGANYRSPFEIQYNGEAQVKYGPWFVPANYYGPSHASARIQYPQTAAIGYAYRPIKDLKIEFDIEWTNWDMLNDVKLHSSNPSFDSDIAPANTTHFDWMDSFFYELGAEWKFAEQWALRAGYIFSENSVPNHTFGPVVADTDRHIFSVGLGWTLQRIIVDFAYQYTLGESRDVSVGTVVDGTWKSNSHAIMLTGTFRF